MAFTLNNHFKFDLALLRRKGYKVGTPSALYNYKDDKDGSTLTYLLLFIANELDSSRGQLRLVGMSYDQTIDLVRVPSNLGVTGGQWYFVCPVTFTRCRTLYYDGSRLVARQALGGIFYQCQHHGPSSRPFWKAVDPGIKFKVMTRDWLHKPYTKGYYRDKPTRMMRRFLKVQDQLLAQQNQ